MAEERVRRTQAETWKIKPSDISAAKVLDFAKKLTEVRTYIDAPKLVATDLVGALSVVTVAEQVTKADLNRSHKAAATGSIYGLLAEVVHGIAMKHG